MSSILLIITGLAVLVIQTSILGYFNLRGVTPNMVLLIVVYYALSKTPAKSQFYGFCFGILEDCLSGSILGMNAVSKTIIGFFGGYIRRQILISNIFIQAAIIFFASIIDGHLIYLYMNVFGDKTPYLIRLKTIIAPETALNTVIGPFFLLFLTWLFGEHKKIRAEKKNYDYRTN